MYYIDYRAVVYIHPYSQIPSQSTGAADNGENGRIVVYIGVIIPHIKIRSFKSKGFRLYY